MVEIALCLGIIAFALVAIMGVLPTGLKVQKENREETIINQDGLYLLEAIRTGAKGMDNLTNHIESITVVYGRNVVVFTNTTANVPNRLTNAQQIVGLLTTPKQERLPSGLWRTNLVEARIRAIGGVASDRGSVSEEMAFRYLMRVEIMPFATHPLSIAASSSAFSTNLLHNLYDVRLQVRWPLFPKGDTWDTGRGRKLFRTLVSGELREWRPANTPYSFYWFDPNAYTTNQYTANF